MVITKFNLIKLSKTMVLKGKLKTITNAKEAQSLGSGAFVRSYLKRLSLNKLTENDSKQIFELLLFSCLFITSYASEISQAIIYS